MSSEQSEQGQQPTRTFDDLMEIAKVNIGIRQQRKKEREEAHIAGILQAVRDESAATIASLEQKIASLEAENQQLLEDASLEPDDDHYWYGPVVPALPGDKEYEQGPCSGSDDSQLEIIVREPVPYGPTPIARQNKQSSAQRQSTDLLQSDEAELASTQDGHDLQSATDNSDKIFSSDEEQGITSENWHSMRDAELLAKAGDPKTPAQFRQRNLLLMRNRADLFIHVWMEENNDKGCLRGWEHSTTLEMAVQYILITTPRPVLDGLMHGDLARKARLPQNDRLRRALLRADRQASDKQVKQPCIYAIFLVNKTHGLAPTWEEIIKIEKSLRTYVDDADFANEVDCVFGLGRTGKAVSTDTTRRYLARSQENAPQEKRLEDLLAFCKGLRARILEAKQQPGYNVKNRMATPLCEVGYTNDAVRRKTQHQTHTESNALMNLVDAVCRHLYGTKYTMEFFVIYCIPESILVGLAEHLFSTLCQSYHKGGTGFNTVAAGNSTGTAKLVTKEQADAHREYVQREVDTKANSNALMKRAWQFNHVGEKLLRELSLQKDKDRIAKQAAKERDKMEKDVKKELTRQAQMRELARLEAERDAILNDCRSRWGDAKYEAMLQHISDQSSQTMAVDSQSDGIDAGYEADVDESED
ncbi:hypothetical protein MBLNU13_g05331t1 [Cladosporium sp. NU13]